MPTPRDILEQTLERSYEMQTAIEHTNRFAEPSDEYVQNAILTQMGYYREDTRFVSLNLTPEQMRVVTDSVIQFPNWTIEELITEGLKRMNT